MKEKVKRQKGKTRNKKLKVMKNDLKIIWFRIGILDSKLRINHWK